MFLNERALIICILIMLLILAAWATLTVQYDYEDSLSDGYKIRKWYFKLIKHKRLDASIFYLATALILAILVS